MLCSRCKVSDPDKVHVQTWVPKVQTGVCGFALQCALYFPSVVSLIFSEVMGINLNLSYHFIYRYNYLLKYTFYNLMLVLHYFAFPIKFDLFFPYLFSVALL